MKLRVSNSEKMNIVVILEPYGSEFIVEPGDYIEFVSDTETPKGSHWLTEPNPGYIVVWPEWQGCIVSTFDSSGNLID